MIKPMRTGSHMPPSYLRHGFEQKSLVTEAMSGFTVGMLAKFTRAQLRRHAMFLKLVAGGVVSQADPAAISHVLSAAWNQP